MTIIIFTGPTLPPHEAEQFLQATYLPPVSEGDVYRAALGGPRAIGIIDGYFENVPAVWHKEILYAMSKGIPVFGSASMGALRAAELAQFGMEGVGAVFQAYRDGVLEDDDEVAVIHGPAELGYPMLSEAMVNIRRTLTDAAKPMDILAVLRHPRKPRTGLLKDLPYRAQKLPARSCNALEDSGLAVGAKLTRLRAWLPGGRVDQKREDAIAMLRVLADRYAANIASQWP